MFGANRKEATVEAMELKTTILPGDSDETDTPETQSVHQPLSDSTYHSQTETEATMSSSTLNSDSIYDFYVNELFPALLSSFPILLGRIRKDTGSCALALIRRFVVFVKPKWMVEYEQVNDNGSGGLLSGEHPLAQQLWEHAITSSKTGHATIADFMLRNFDKDKDGHISPSELLNMTELLAKLPTRQPPQIIPNVELSFWAWFSREWPLMDWKIGVFLWQTFGGILLVIAFLSIMPGRLHTWSAKVLRWPILGLTYLLINIELVVYIAIRLVIRIIEVIVANPKHRALRSKMANSSNSYQEWYQTAAELDRSQKRNLWQSTTTDETSYQYNWPLIKQLLEDMREARTVQKDPILALAVLQQCTRKNVGGIMNEDLFTKTYTGEPKFIVMEFIDEVTKTLRWVTDQTLEAEATATIAEASSNGREAGPTKRKRPIHDTRASLFSNKAFQEHTKAEYSKLWRSLVAFATLDFQNADSKQENIDNEINQHAVSSRTNNNEPEKDVNKSPRSQESSSTSSNSQSASSAPPPINRQQLLRFLKRAKHAYGRTALCLSGGSMMGLYHLGHLKGLMETDCLPQIVSGCSAGSAIGAVLCTRTNDELHRDLDPRVIGPHLHCFDRSWPDRFRSIWKTGNIFRGEDWLDMIKWFSCGDMTFEEAYRKTGRILCVALAATAKKTPPILINYISAPNVTIASAVVASAAVPGFVSPQQLQCKDPDGTVRSAGPETYFDGSIRHDIPTAGLSEMLNCHFFVACQCNPHIVPFFFNPKGGVGRPSRWTGEEQETSWRGGFLLAALEMYLKNDMRAKFVFLQDLDAAVSFTGTMMTQSFVGTTTIVPQVELRDFFTLFSDPTISRLYHYLRVGSVAAYQHAAMIRCHYRIADALEECIEKLDGGHSKALNSNIEPNTIEVSPTKKKVSRRASFEVGDMSFGNGNKPHDGVPKIITSTSSYSAKPRKDSDSLSTSSETYVPNL